MRASPRLLADVEAELKRQPDKTGMALMAEYSKAVHRLERAVDELDYSKWVMNNVAEGARRLQSWLDRKQRERSERPSKK